jgi:predicted NUDIX family phosphoesterase
MVVKSNELSDNYFNKLNLTNSINLPDTLFKRRGCMEENPSFKQLIPYVIVTNENNEILMYKRSTKGGESRLHNVYSIGFGGHIDEPENRYMRTPVKMPADSKLSTLEDDFAIAPGTPSSGKETKEIIHNSLIREMEEELGTSINWVEHEFKFKGTIYNDKDEVGQVHLGLLYVVKINSKKLLEEGELDIVTDRQFLSVDKLSGKDGLEAWSKFIVEKLEEVVY